MGCHSLLQGILWTQGSNRCLLHYRQILYHLSHQGIVKSVETKNRAVGARDREREGEIVELLFYADTVSVLQDEKVLENDCTTI